MARHFSPAAVTFYLLDFGANGLAPLRKLPHVADTLLIEETEKILKFLRILDAELSRRKRLLADAGVGNMVLYRQMTGQQEPSLVLVVDSFDAIKGESFEEELMKLMTKVSREGLSLGIHIMMTASRQPNLRATLYSNFKHQLTLKQHDVYEVRNIVGATPLADIEDLPGRALMKRDELDLVQVALPNAAHSTIQMLETLRQEASRMRDDWTGQLPAEIPMVPDELTEEDFYSRPSVETAIQAGEIPLGLDMETVEAVRWRRSKGSFVYLVEDELPMLQLTHQLVNISNLEERFVTILAPLHHQLSERIGADIHSSLEERTDMIRALADKVRERIAGHRRDFIATIIVYDMNNLVEDLDRDVLSELAFVLEKGHQAGYCSIVMANATITKNIDAASKVVKTAKEGLVGMRLSDQTLFTVTNKPLREAQLDSQVHYYIADNKATKVKVLMKD